MWSGWERQQAQKPWAVPGASKAAGGSQVRAAEKGTEEVLTSEITSARPSVVA